MLITYSDAIIAILLSLAIKPILRACFRSTEAQKGMTASIMRRKGYANSYVEARNLTSPATPFLSLLRFSNEQTY